MENKERKEERPFVGEMPFQKIKIFFSVWNWLSVHLRGRHGVSPLSKENRASPFSTWLWVELWREILRPRSGVSFIVLTKQVFTKGELCGYFPQCEREIYLENNRQEKRKKRRNGWKRGRKSMEKFPGTFWALQFCLYSLNLCFAAFINPDGEQGTRETCLGKALGSHQSWQLHSRLWVQPQAVACGADALWPRDRAMGGLQGLHVPRELEEIVTLLYIKQNEGSQPAGRETVIKPILKPNWPSCCWFSCNLLTWDGDYGRGGLGGWVGQPLLEPLVFVRWQPQCSGLEWLTRMLHKHGLFYSKLTDTVLWLSFSFTSLQREYEKFRVQRFRAHTQNVASPFANLPIFFTH